MNLGAIRKEKNTSCKFGSLLVCTLFLGTKFFSYSWYYSMGYVEDIYGIDNDLISQLGENFEAIMDNYFEEFKRKKKN